MAEVANSCDHYEKSNNFSSLREIRDILSLEYMILFLVWCALGG